MESMFCFFYKSPHLKLVSSCVLVDSDYSGDGSTSAAATNSATSSSYAVMAATQVRCAGGICNPLLQVCA